MKWERIVFVVALWGCQAELVVEGSSAGGGAGGVFWDPPDCESPATVTLTGTVIACDVGAPINYWTCDNVANELEVCIRGCDNLCTTSSDGRWTLPRVPAESEVILLYAMKKHIKSASAIRTRSQDEFVYGFTLTPTAAEEYAQAAGFDWPPNGRSYLFVGVVSAPAFNSGVVGAKLTISPTALAGPVYWDETDLAAPALDSISTDGWAGFEVSQGEYLLTVVPPPSVACSPATYGEAFPGGGWPGPTDDTLRFPALPDTFMASAVFACE